MYCLQQNLLGKMFLPLLLLLLLMSTVAWYLWKKYSPYFSFHTYFFCNWHVILTILRGKGPRNKPLSVYLIHLLQEFCIKHLEEGIVAMWFPEPVIVVFGPEAVKFLANEPSLVDKPWPYQYFDGLDKDGIFRSSGKRAKKQRKLLSPAFFSSMMKYYLETVNDHALCLVHELGQLKNQTANDIGKIIKSRTMSLFCEATLGIKMTSCDEDSRIDIFIKIITRAMSFVVYRIYRPWLHFDFMLPFFSEGRKHRKNMKDLHSVVKKIIEEMKELHYLRTKSKDHNNTDPYLHEQSKTYFGDVLLEEQLKDPTFTNKDLETEIITLITAGYDTASYSLMWSLWLLGLYHDIQEKAYEEVKIISGEVIDYEEVRNLTYLECIIKESLRLYTVVPMFARVSKKDLYFGSYKIPGGTKIIFTPRVAHLHPEIYPEPDVFNPDRFLESESKIKSWNFLPFAESVRSCIGKNYAMLEMKVFLAHVIRNFKIVSLTPREDVEICWEVFLKSSVPLSVKFISR